MKCRKRSDDIETRVQLLPWDKPGGCLSIGLVVSGTKVARARFRLQCGTWERLAPMGSASCWRGRREGAPQAAETCLYRPELEATARECLEPTLTAIGLPPTHP